MKSRILALGLALPLAIAGLAGCSGSGGAAGDWPKDIKDNYMNSCSAQGSGLDDYCQCTLDELESKYSGAEFAELEKKISAGDDKATKDLMDLAQSCMDKIG